MRALTSGPHHTPLPEMPGCCPGSGFPQRRRVMGTGRLAGVTAATAGHLFDPSYEATLTAAEVGLRDRLRAVAEYIRDVPPAARLGVAWEEVRALLARLGDRGGGGRPGGAGARPETRSGVA